MSGLQRWMIEVVGGIVAHAEPFHHLPRRGVCHARKGDDLRQIKGFESESKPSPGSLGCVPLSPGRSRQPPADLDTRIEGQQMRRSAETDETKEPARGPFLDRLKAEAVLPHLRDGPFDQGAAFLPAQGGGKVAHHLTVRTQRRKGIEIGRHPWPQDQSLGLKNHLHMRHLRCSGSLQVRIEMIHVKHAKPEKAKHPRHVPARVFHVNRRCYPRTAIRVLGLRCSCCRRSRRSTWSGAACREGTRWRRPFPSD